MVSTRLMVTGLLAGCAAAGGGCNSMLNSWLDPTTLGTFSRTGVSEIRTSLTLEDIPTGIAGAVYPTKDDLRVDVREYPISAGDQLDIEVFELRQRLQPFQARVSVSTAGYVNLPVVGRVDAAGLTVPQFEEALIDILREREILLEPEVTVYPFSLQKATYSIFGIGASASTDAPLRAGTFPIRRADLKILEAVNLVGGLSEFVTDVYIFRQVEPIGVEVGSSRGPPPARPPEELEPMNGTEGLEPVARSPEEEIEDVVLEPEEPQDTWEGARSPEDQQPDERSRGLKPAAQGGDPAETLQPEPTQPWIFIDGEFVENPTYSGPPRFEPSSGPPLPWDTTTPAVDWARLAGEPYIRIIRIPADQLRAGNTEVNVIVRAGDVVRIISGEIGLYYVMGQVNRVGAFGFNAEPITLKAAIASAGGLSSLAWPDRCTVYRRIGQREQMIQVNLDRVFAGKDADFYIKRGDIVNVGTHPFAPFLQRIRSWTLPNPTSNVGYSYTYARNFADIDSFAVRRNPHNEPDLFPSLFP